MSQNNDWAGSRQHQLAASIFLRNHLRLNTDRYEIQTHERMWSCTCVKSPQRLSPELYNAAMTAEPREAQPSFSFSLISQTGVKPPALIKTDLSASLWRRPRTCKNRYRAGVWWKEMIQPSSRGEGWIEFNDSPVWTMSQSKASLLDSTDATTKRPACETHTHGGVFIPNKSRNWASSSQTLSNNDQPQKEADNKTSGGLNLLIARPAPRLCK